MDAKRLVEVSKFAVRDMVSQSEVSSWQVIARYTATFAVNFTDWLGRAYPWVRHELSQHALKDNLRCEAEQDHVEMLLAFAHSCGAEPTPFEHSLMRGPLRDVRALFKKSENAGLGGLALCAVLEGTSAIFIPDLAKRGAELGCKSFAYTDVHGEADIEHADAFTKALEAECGMGYSNPELTCHRGAEAALRLIRVIYS